MIRFLKKVDPLFWLLRLLMYNYAFKNLKNKINKLKNKNNKKAKDQIKNAEITLADITANTHKQSLSIYISGLVLYVAHFDISTIKAENAELILSTVGPVLTGFIVSWYVITFGSIKKEYIKEGLVVTFFMFTTFVTSLGILGMIAFYLLPTGLAYAIGFILTSGLVGSFKYDMVDLLRIGIDEEGLKFYIRANKKMDLMM